MKKSIFLSLGIFFIIFSSITVLAHSGRTDSNGGHNDNINDGYHYHHGYSAHEHPNNKCPYIKENTKTDINNKENLKSSSYSTIEIIGIILGSLFLGYLFACIPTSVIVLLFMIFYRGKNKDDIIWWIFKILATILTIIISIIIILSFLKNN